MTHLLWLPVSEEAAVQAILIDAARCWREARDSGQAVQPCLSQVLAAHDCTMLAPVLDSLILFYETALGRPLMVGRALMLSDDEYLLLGLMDGTRRRCGLPCAKSVGVVLDCALRSTRIMLVLTLRRAGAQGRH